MMKCIYHYIIIQTLFTAVKILCACPIHPSSQLPWMFSVYSNPFSGPKYSILLMEKLQYRLVT